MPVTINGDGIVTAEGTSTTQGRLRLGEDTDNGTNYVELQAPASVASNVTFTLPSADGTNGQVLQTNGSGALSFANATSLASPLAVVGNSTAGAEIRLPEDTDNGSNYVALKAADNLASNLTFTLPSADGTSGQVLQTNASGTLSFANLAVANGGTGQTSLTSNNVILGNGTSAVQFVAPGTNGNILTSNGTTWQSTAPAGGGSWIWLSTVSATSGTYANVETTFNSTYDVYAIVISGARPNTDNVDMFMEVKLAGSYRTSSDYKYHLHRLRSASTLYTATANGSQVNITIAQSVQGDNANTLNYVIYVMNPSQTSSSPYYHIFGQGSQNEQSNTEIYGLVFAGGYVAASSFSPLEGVRFSWSSGQWSTGNLRLYGIKNS